ncbi:MAG: hypothetical protein FD127_681 [Acidimicrobiaceae bacterium]|nr:MAG: hypothetical protein FD127_681 [Acidimicrobiaceae bacterium]
MSEPTLNAFASTRLLADVGDLRVDRGYDYADRRSDQFLVVEPRVTGTIHRQQACHRHAALLLAIPCSSSAGSSTAAARWCHSRPPTNHVLRAPSVLASSNQALHARLNQSSDDGVCATKSCNPADANTIAVFRTSSRFDLLLNPLVIPTSSAIATRRDVASSLQISTRLRAVLDHPAQVPMQRLTHCAKRSSCSRVRKTVGVGLTRAS